MKLIMNIIENFDIKTRVQCKNYHCSLLKMKIHSSSRIIFVRFNLTENCNL